MDNKTKFSKEEEEKLIDLIRQNEVLYQISHPDYRNSFLKNKTWKNIAATMEKSMEDCKSKWKVMRDYQRRQKAANKKGTGSSSDGIVPADDKLAFLDGSHFVQRLTKSNFLTDLEKAPAVESVDVHVDEGQEAIVLDLPVLQRIPTSNSNKRAPPPQNEKDELRVKLMKKMVDRPNIPLPPPPDNLEKFFSSLADTMRGFPKKEIAI
ncbi:uncharacterized protein LOC120348702 [Nilaparvata lugens]|nr:uncharacterized protein LOC120348702 [Nilaparvata lugens]